MVVKTGVKKENEQLFLHSQRMCECVHEDGSYVVYVHLNQVTGAIAYDRDGLTGGSAHPLALARGGAIFHDKAKNIRDKMKYF